MAITEPLQDPAGIADAADLSESIGNYGAMILERLDRQGYQKPEDGRTFPAVVYVAARDEGEPVTVEEVADAAGVSETAVAREYKRVVRELDLSGLELVPGEEYIRRYADSLDLSEETRQVALDLFDEGRESLFGSRTPSVSAAMCLYAASCITGADLTQDDFTEFGVAEVSIRKGYREVLALRDGEVPESNRMSKSDVGTLREAVEQVHRNIGNVPDATFDEARSLVEGVKGAEFLSGKSPEPVAAAIYWLAANRTRVDVTQQEAADAAGTHKVTVNRRVSDVRAALDDA